MPIVDMATTQRIGHAPTVSTADPTVSDQPLSGIVADAFLLENSIGAYVGNDLPERTAPIDTDFDPIALIPAGLEEAGGSRYIMANTADEVDAVTRQVRKELGARQRNSEAGILGMVANMVIGGIDPIAFIPVGGVLYKTYRGGGSILRGALATGTAAAASMSVQEAAIHHNQVTRTLGESAVNVTAVMFLAGIIGGGAAALRNHNAKQIAEILSQVDEDLTVPSGSVGSMKAGLSGEDLGIKRNAAVTAVAKVVGFQDPVFRSILADSDVSRTVMPQLAEVPQMMQRNELGIETPISVERNVKVKWEAPLYNALRVQDDMYTQYVKGRSKRFGDIVQIGIERKVGMHGDKLTKREFRKAVGHAMRNDDVHAIPEVQKVAENYRAKILDPMLDEAIELGLLPPDVDVTTAKSFLNRMYSREMLVARPEGFIDATTDWLVEKQVAATDRIETFKMLKVTLASIKAEAAEQVGAMAHTQKKATGDIARMTTQVDTKLKQARSIEVTIRPIQTRANSKADGVEQLKQTVGEQSAVILKLETGLRAARKVGVEPRRKLDSRVRAITAAKAKRKLLQQRASTAAVEFKVLDTQVAKAKARMIQMQGDIATLRTKIHDLKEVATRSGEELAHLKQTTAAKVRDAQIDVDTRVAQHGRDVDDLTRDVAELRSVAHDIRRQILGSPGGRLPYGMQVNTGGPKKAGRAGSLQQRSFLIEDSRISDYLEDDIEILMKSYVHSVGPDLELTRAFGDIEMTHQRRDLADELNLKLKHVTTEKGKKALEDKFRTLDRDMVAVAERIRGVYKLPDDPLAWGPRASRTVRELNYIAKLGGMTLSAIPDMSRIVMVHGFGRVFGDLVAPLITNFKGFSKLSKEIREDMGAATDMLVNSRARALAGIDDEMLRLTLLERGVGAMSDTFGMVSLMAPWNTAMKQMAGVVSSQRLIRAMKAERAGTIKPAELEYLRSAGIGADSGASILKSLKAHGANRGKLNLPNIADWGTDKAGRDAADLFAASVTRDVDRIIITPGQDRPLIATGAWGEFGKHLFQFKSFGIASTQRTLIAGLQQADAAALNGMWLATALGMAVTALKAADAGREIPDFSADNVDWWLKEGIDRSGLTGWAFDANNVVEKATRGHFGVSAMMGQDPMSRYASRTALGAMFGPTLGSVGDMVSVVGSAANATVGDEPVRESDVTAMRRLIPYNNLLGFRQVVDQAEAAINEALGAKR